MSSSCQACAGLGDQGKGQDDPDFLEPTAELQRERERHGDVAAEAVEGACQRPCEPNQEGRAGAIGEQQALDGDPADSSSDSPRSAQSRAVGSWSGRGPRGQQPWGMPGLSVGHV